MSRVISDCLSDDSGSSEDYNSAKEVKFVFPENRTRWETDTKCSVCRINFNIPGVAHTEKGKCYFCYRGVCRRCLDSTKKHPESLVKEKICKVCVVEFKQVRFFANQIEESRLERSQLWLEVELAAKEHHEIADQRKQVQQSLETFKLIDSSTVAEKELSIDELKGRLSELTTRHEISQTKYTELNQEIKCLNQKLEEFKKKANKWRNKNAQKDLEEKKNNKKIENVRLETLDLLHSVQRKSTAVGEVVESVQKLRRSVEKYENNLKNMNKGVKELQDSFHSGDLRRKELELAIEKLDQTIANASKDEDEMEITQEGAEKLKNAEMDLEKLNEIIGKLNERLELLKKRTTKKHLSMSDTIEKSYTQSGTLAGISHKKTTEANKSDTAGTSTCQKCIVY